MELSTESTMAIDAKLNSNLNDIQLSNLNFAIKITPYAAYITIKKSTLVDMNGVSTVPTPPTFLLLQQSYRDYTVAQEEISMLNNTVKDLEVNCENLKNVNASLISKLEVVEASLAASNEEKFDLQKKIDNKDLEVIKLLTERSEAESKVKNLKKEYVDFSCEADTKIKSLNKVIKTKDKEIHNLTRNVDNGRDTVKNFKIKTSQLETDIKQLEKKIRKFESRGEQYSTSTQTYFTSDTPYSVTEALPPIFGSQLCDQIPGVEKCAICCLTFNSSKALQVHNKEYPLCCRECSICFATSHEVNQHDANQHSHETDSEEQG